MIQSAQAATWPVSTSELSASVGYHQTYTAGVESYVHSGIDIPASAGLQIVSPLAGTVRFTGAVPSGDSRIGSASSDKTMKAITIEIANGRVITLMPFASIAVSDGQYVSEGTVLGTLAASGDISSAAAHVHLGYKEGSCYLDPMQLFGNAAPTAGQEQTGEVLSSSADTLAPFASAASAVEAFVPVHAGDEAVSQDALEGEQVSSFETIETGAYELKSSVSTEPSAIDAITAPVRSLGLACLGQLEALVATLVSLSEATGISLTVVMAVAALLGVALCTLICAFAVRVAIPWITSHIENSSLSKRLGGDSMHKLFPASGAAFMSRSRIARGR